MAQTIIFKKNNIFDTKENWLYHEIGVKNETN
jgi:hypothetical protein